ncbi:MAG: leucine-rich repeat domain-containing protein, partial [Kiritimatiellae bacterium]|nr:leucine-rich repeat domain-containing protein [Kiritimatiellia bacterium]
MSKLKDVELHEGIEEISASAFYQTGIERLVLPDSVTTINGGAFSGCSNLTEIVFGAGIKEISGGAFSGCVKLTSVSIPDSVTAFAGDAFSGCNGLMDLEVPVAWYGTDRLDGVELPDGCRVTYRGTEWTYTTDPVSGTATVTGANPAAGALTIPAMLGGYPVTSIGYQAFYNCTNLTSVAIPSSVTNIGRYTFQNDNNLTAVYIDDLGAWCRISFGDFYSNPLYYAHRLFLNGQEVRDLVIPDGVTRIEDNAFSRMFYLSSLTIPESVRSIGGYAFVNGRELKSLVIPGSVTNIGTFAFEGCSSLTNAIIGNGVASIGEMAFADCRQMRSVTVGSGLSNIGKRAFYNCPVLQEAVLPDAVEHIGLEAFSGFTASAFERLEVGSALADAVFAVPEGPEVRIEARAGTYGPIWTSNKVVRIVGLEGPEATIIDASGTSGRCATLINERETYSVYVTNTVVVGTNTIQRRVEVGCQTNTILEGFTLTGKTNTYGPGAAYGGTLVGCHVVSNKARTGGGLAYGNAFNCRFEANEDSNTSLGGGALFRCAGAENCMLTGNRGADGGAAREVASLRGCEIRDNEAFKTGGGLSACGEIDGCTIAGNRTPSGDGGGVISCLSVRNST